MELQHYFSHEHPLILKENTEVINREVHKCYVCDTGPISGPYYYCSGYGCNYFLHKQCAELPSNLTHQLHPKGPKHTLVLHLLSSSSKNTTTTSCCMACGETITSIFTYRCCSCDFEIDIICALRARAIKLRCHQHKLIPIHKRAMFTCDACQRWHGGISYLCTTCKFCVHQDCAWLPTNITFSKHEFVHSSSPATNSLKLAYSLPSNFKIRQSNFKIRQIYCQVCRKKMEEVDWAYCCDGCRYIAHVKCVITTSNELPFREEPKFEEEGNQIHLPVSDESVNLLRHLSKNKSEILIPDDHELNNNYSYPHHPHHQLILCEKGESETSSIDVMRICNACVQPIFSVPFYRCGDNDCNFFLHKLCTNFPNKIRHRCHPGKTLTLYPNAPNKACGIFKCDGCRQISNGFSFTYYFNLDVTCASLPITIKHEGHNNHILILKRISSPTPCSACDDLFAGFAYACDKCKFIVQIYCALLPKSVKRERYDRKHSFTLTYSPVKGEDVYICDFCEEYISPKWFYHCEKCNRSLHPRCIWKHDPYSNIKFGSIFNIEGHEHELKLVRQTKLSPTCNKCSKRDTEDYDSGLVLECTSADCNYLIHPTCAYPIYKKPRSSYKVRKGFQLKRKMRSKKK